MNLNNRNLKIVAIKSYNELKKYMKSYRKVSFYDYELLIQFFFFQISRILLRPINRAEVIVKAASRKPK